jgi:hypothetical protein
VKEISAMKAIKFLLLSALAFGLGLYGVLWLGSVRVPAPGRDAANGQAGASLLTSEPLRYSYSDYDSPPKLDLPDKITAAIEPEEPSPFVSPGPPMRNAQAARAVQLGARVLKDSPGISESIEFRALEAKARSDWQTPPRLNLKPGGLSTPFSKPDWYDHPPLDRTLDQHQKAKPGSGL